MLGPLGRGGMGVVYRGAHVDTGDVVALKTVDALGEGHLATIRREIRALARIRHPAIVRIVGHGVHEGLPWYAMPVLEGRTLRDHIRGLRQLPPRGRDTDTDPDAGSVRPAWWTETLMVGGVEWQSKIESQRAFAGALTIDLDDMDGLADAEDVRAGRPASAGDGSGPAAEGGAPTELPAIQDAEGLQPVLELVHALCAPLAFLHGEGIVHCDLKPENVVVERDGGVVLVDFGLISRFGGQGREVLDVQESLSGTVHYMSPEQIRGQLPDPRSDLYALGCLLFWMITGREPFHGDVSAMVALQHLEVEAPSAGIWAKGLPPALEELIARLLAKDPQDRLGHASDVASVLQLLGVSGTTATPPPQARAYLYRPGLVGREPQIELLAARVQALDRRGAGGLLLVTGPTGAGKTRFAGHVAILAKARRARAIGATCLPRAALRAGHRDAGEAPLQGLVPVLEAIADRCRERGPAETERLFGSRAGVLELFLPGLAALPGLVAHAAPADLAPEAARLRVFAYLLETLEAFALEHPLVLIIDDLQWADELTVAALRYLARATNKGRSRILVVAVARDEGVPETLAEVAVERIRLSPLGEDAIGRMVADMLGQREPPLDLAGFLTVVARGNPLYITEFLRAAVEEGQLFRDLGGRWRLQEGRSTEQVYQAFGAPRRLQALLARRLDRLPPAPRRLLSAASVLGRAVEPDLLGQVAGLDAAATVAGLDQLLRLEILKEVEGSAIGAESGGSRLELVQAAHREAAYDRLTLPEKRELHQAAAEALEHRIGASHVQLAAIGEHWVRAGVPRRGLAYYLTGARAAAAHFAPGDAEQLYRTWLELSAGIDRSRDLTPAERISDRVHVMIELALVLEANAYRREAEALYVEAQAAVADQPDLGFLLARVHGRLGQLKRIVGQYEAASQHLEQARLLWVEVGDMHGLGETLGFIGRLRQELDELELAETLYLQLQKVAGDLADHRMVALSHGYLGRLYLQQGRLPEAQAAFEQQHGVSVAIGALRRAAQALGCLGHVAFVEGDYVTALGRYGQELASVEALGDKRGVGTVLRHLGEGYRDAGEYVIAIECLAEALRVKLELADPGGVGLVLGVLGETLAESGQYRRAGQVLELALRVLARTHVPRHPLRFCYASAHLLARTRRYSAATALVERVLAPGALPEPRYRTLARLLAVRIRAAAGTLSSGAAVAELEAIGPDLVGRELQAEYHRSLWRVDPSRADDRARAAELYAELHQRAPRARLGLRYQELAGRSLPNATQLPPPPQLPRDTALRSVLEEAKAYAKSLEAVAKDDGR